MAERRFFRHSHHADRALTLPRPRWRGRTHRAAAWVSLPLGVWLTFHAPPGAPRVACAIFATGVLAMFAASGINHLRRWSPHTTEVMVRVDHTGVYLAIAGTATAVAVLGLPPTAARIALWVVWIAAAAGIGIEWLPFASPRGLNNTIYLTLGWAGILTVPFLWVHSGPLAVLLLLFGGVLYTIGVVVIIRQRPNPDPHVFGYHEIWHVFVIAAIAAHYANVAFVLL